MNSLLPLITNLSTKNREYVVFVGAGFSKDAGIKSGWDILIETLKPLFIDEKKLDTLPENHYEEIENWYLGHQELSKQGYSEILEILYPGEMERREYLKQFFGNVQPGESHRQLAEMVQKQLVRYIFTTNFDDLIEKALDERGVDYDVIYSDDILQYSKSWDKVEICRIYKLHGDHKTGKVRNTLSELEYLEPLIADDFQYIIDRHGLIVIGYAGRDEGVMQHFLKRRPHYYPIYWQYVSQPPQTEEFKYFHELLETYEAKQSKITLIENNSASSFLSELNNGTEILERALIISESNRLKFRTFITNNDEKKIKTFSVDLLKQYDESIRRFIEKENLNRLYTYKFGIFEEFLGEIHFVFDYLDELLSYRMEEEAIFFLLKLLRNVSEYWHNSNEFIRYSSPYYLFLCGGALFLKHEITRVVDNLYNLKIQIGSRAYVGLAERISYQNREQVWGKIAEEKFKKRFNSPRYSIIRDFLLPESISSEQFDAFDAYISIDILFNETKIDWLSGSSSYYGFYEVFQKYFLSQIETSEESEEFIKTLKQRYSDSFHLSDGIYETVDFLTRKFQIETN